MAEIRRDIIRIVSAVKLTAAEGQSLAKPFARKHQLEDYDLQLDVDAELIAGVIVYVGDFRYDQSVRGQLERLSGKIKEKQSSLSEQEREDWSRQKPLSHWLSELKSPPDGGVMKEGEPAHDKAVATDLDVLPSLASVDEIGQILSLQDGVALITGMHGCLNYERIQIGDRASGIAMNLQTDQVGVVVLEGEETIHPDDLCKRTGSQVQVPVGKALLGRVVNALARPIDGLGAIRNAQQRPVERMGPTIVARKPIDRSLHTGITAIDALTPIGFGQRELIIGDRQTGKTTLAIDTLLNQKGKSVYCVYVAIGQKMSTIAETVNLLRQKEALDYTTVVAAAASESAALQYLAPYTGCTIAESFMEEGADVLVIYDDLSKHAQAYRTISLLLRRPPGREAYPGDIFYLHARLLERACQLSDAEGGGSLTALPIVETQGGDISAYIPTNVISITDGQIYLESDLFFSGQRPAINVGLSVSRVGGAAQSKAMHAVAGPLRIKLAQYRELEAFMEFGAELEQDTLNQLKIGMGLLEVLKQGAHQTLSIAKQVIDLHLTQEGYLLKLDREDIRPFLRQFFEYLQNRYPTVVSGLNHGQEFLPKAREQIGRVLTDFWTLWHKRQDQDT